MSRLQIGERCLANEATGVIRFIGNTKFAPGIWVGVELNSASGKNDGSVQGERYFHCPPDHGVFVRSTKVILLNGAEISSTVNESASERKVDVFKVPVLQRAEQRTPSRLSRPASRVSIGSRAPSDSVQKTSSTHYEADTPHRPPVQRKGSSFSSSANAQDTRDARREAQSSRSDKTQDNSRSTNTSDVLVTKSVETHAEEELKAGTPKGSAISRAVPDKKETISDDPHDSASERDKSAWDRSRMIPTEGRIVEIEKLMKVITDLKRKITALESIRAEDLHKLSSLGALESEKEAWLSIRAKLRDKLQSQQQDIRNLKERISVLESSVETAAQASGESHDATYEALELATLDREVAEEERDHLKLELEEQGSRIEELTLELEILKEQAVETGVPINRTAAELRSIELSNDKLREALIRLKEITNEQETSLHTLKKENDKLIQDRHSARNDVRDLQARVSSMQQIIEDLKDSVNISIGAEEMLESLTERNLVLGEQVERYRAEITHLEALKDLNDELEEGHSEARRELNLQIHLQQRVIDEQTSRLVFAEEQESYLLEAVRHFRSEISSLQSEIARLHTSEQEGQLRNSRLSQQAHDLLNKNTDLQVKGLGTSLKKLDIGLMRHEAACAIEHLNIIREYVPEPCTDDQEAIEVYMTFKSAGGLCRLLFDYFQDQREMLGFDDLHQQVSISLILLQIASSVCRCVSVIASATIQEFLLVAHIANDVHTLERGLSTVVDNVKNDSTSETDLLRSLEGIAEMTRAMEAVYSDKDVAHDSSFCLWMLDTTCSESTAMLSLVRKILDSRPIPVPDHVQLQSTNVALIANAISKLHKPVKIRLQREGFQYSILTGPAAVISLELTRSVCEVLAMILQLLKHATSVPDEASSEDQQELVVSIYQRVEQLLPQAEAFLGTTDFGQGSNLIEAPGQSVIHTSPWHTRASLLRNTKSVDQETQLRLQRLEQELQATIFSVHAKGKQLEEEKVKVSALERRLLENQGIEATLKALETSEAKFVSDRKAYEDAIEELNDQLESLQERVTQPLPESREALVPSVAPHHEPLSQKEISILRRTVTHLAGRLAKVQCAASSKHLEFLSRPLLPQYNKVKKLRTTHYDKELLDFYGQLKFVDFQGKSAVDTKWVPMRDKCGYIHYAQEETYAYLVANNISRVQQH